MDKETISAYGWVVVAIIILSVMIIFATPYAMNNINNMNSTANSLTGDVNAAMNGAGANIGGTGDIGENTDTTSHTSYSTAEISQNANMQAIGATKAEYVVAKLSADETTLTITLNNPPGGDPSDGKMRNWTQSSLQNTIQNVNKSSIKRVIINEGVFNIGDYAFDSLNNITSVSIASTVKIIGSYAFYGCKGITNITMPTALSTINLGAFNYCSSLSSISIPSSVTEMGAIVFGNCNQLSINCGSLSQPSSWTSNWNPDDRPVNWGASI